MPATANSFYLSFLSSQIAAEVIMAKLLQTFIVAFPQDYKTVIVRDPIAEPRDEYICTLKMRAQREDSVEIM